MQKFTPTIAATVVGALAAIALTSAAVGGPGGYGNAQDTINAAGAIIDPAKVTTCGSTSSARKVSGVEKCSTSADQVE
jgi:hypothetical protein